MSPGLALTPLFVLLPILAPSFVHAEEVPPAVYEAEFEIPDPLRIQWEGSNVPALVEGICGKGARINPEGWLKVILPKKISGAEGTIALWVRSAQDFNTAPVLYGGCLLYAEMGSEEHLVLSGLGDYGGMNFFLERRKDRWPKCSAFPLYDWTDEEWHHLVVTWKRPGLMSLYIDGKLAASEKTTAPSDPVGRVSCLYVGRGGTEASYRAWVNEPSARMTADRLAIYACSLTAGQIEAIYRQDFPVQVRGFLREESEVGVFPIGRKITLLLSIRSLGQLIQRVTMTVRDPGGGSRVFPVACNGAWSFVPDRPGWYRLTLRLTAADRTFTLARKILAVVNRPEFKPGQPGRSNPLNLKIIHEFNCTDDRPDQFRDNHTSKVVQSPLGAYRQSGPGKFDWFAWRFTVRRLHRLHRIEITYPDDAVREFGFSVGKSEGYTVTGGVKTGPPFEQSYTGRMRGYDLYFWPRCADQMIFFLNWRDGSRAAVAGVKVYEVVGPLPEPAVDEARSGPSRYLGNYLEDASLREFWGAGAANLEGIRTTARNLIDYFKFTGQNVLVYPLTWYDGPLFFTRENHRLLPTNKIGYGNLHPPGWLDLLLLEFERAGIGFFGEVYFRDLPVLRIQTDARPWRPGVLSTWDGMAGEAFHAELKHPAGASLFQLYRTGRRRTDWWGTQPLAPGRENIGPMYNPLHPVVRKAYLEVIGEALKRYGRYPAFKGLVLSLGKGWPLRAESLVFDRLDSDYSDLTLERFRTDTGTVVPAPGTTESDRAKERYDWIMRHARQPWIDWRCRKIEEIVGTVAGMVRSTRPELKLVLGLGLSPLPGELAEVRKGARLSEIYREHGLDLRRLAQIPNVVIERWQWDAQFNPADPSPTFIDYTDPETDFLVPNGPTAAANHYNYNETGARSYPGLWEGFSPAICYTITPERSFMRFFAESLARSDVGLLTAGGLGTPPTQGHADQIRPFAQAFRGLPDKPFIQGESVTDAVVLRYRVDEGETFVYLVNRDGYDGEVEVNFQSDFPVDVGELTRPERETVAPGERLKIKLRPYELRSFKIDRKVKPRMDQYHPDSETVETLTKCLAQLDVREPSGGVKELIRQARTALEQRHFHRARRLIDVEIPRRAAWEKWEARERAQITWQLIGPFPQTDLKGHDTVYEPEHDYLAGKEPAPSYRSAAGPVLTWKTVTGTFHSPLAKFGFVDLAEHLGRDEPPTNAVAYAFARIHSEKNLATVLRVYSDDGEKVWVNRCLVTKFGGDRDIEQGSESAVVNFHAGWNTLLVKIEQHTGGWGFIIDLDHRLKSR